MFGVLLPNLLHYKSDEEHDRDHWDVRCPKIATIAALLNFLKAFVKSAESVISLNLAQNWRLFEEHVKFDLEIMMLHQDALNDEVYNPVVQKSHCYIVLLLQLAN